jgi:hypothetical protein
MTLKTHPIVWISVLLFAASIRAQEPGTIPKDTWAEFASDDKRFKLLMPGKPELQTKPLPGVAGMMKIRAVDLKSSVLLIAVAELSAKELARVSAEDRLKRASKGTANVPGRVLVSEKKIDIDNYPGVEVFVKDGQRPEQGSRLLQDRTCLEISQAGGDWNQPTGAGLRRSAPIELLRSSAKGDRRWRTYPLLAM